MSQQAQGRRVLPVGIVANLEINGGNGWFGFLLMRQIFLELLSLWHCANDHFSHFLWGISAGSSYLLCKMIDCLIPKGVTEVTLSLPPQ
jgi:hypothetical protein